MAILTAQQSVNTRDLPELAEIGDGSEYGGTTNANNPGHVGGVDYFGSGSPHYLGLHIELISQVGDLVTGAGIPASMTVTDIEVYASNTPSPNDPMHDIRGISLQITDIWADASDNGKLDTVPAKIFQGDDTLNGSPFDDILFAFAGSDVVLGGGGNDEMNGGDGSDDLTGGRGADIQTGGAGADTFIFLARSDSTKKTSGRDLILDFNRDEGDKVDLSLIDAKKGSGNQAFKFIKKKDFHDKKGELRYKVKDGDAYLQGDTNGDGKADFSIHFDSLSKLKAADFDL